jgi:hypothetical protein
VAKRNYLVEGLSGSGKSSVYEELIRRGYRAISTDRAWKRHADDGGSIWDEQRAVGELGSPEPAVLFVCGSGGNRDRFLPYFAGIFNLRIDDDTMRRRLRERTNNDFGKQPEEAELMLRLNRSDEKPAGAVDVDATQPLDLVVDELLRLAGCGAVSNSTPQPWSRRESPIGRSFVIPEPELPIDLEASEREAIAHLEYAWSGDVLATLLPYLRDQGVDLTYEGSAVVLTSAHRERYLARLDPSEFDGAALRRHYEKLNDTTADGVEYAMLDGIAFLRDTLTPLESATVAVLVIE